LSFTGYTLELNFGRTRFTVPTHLLSPSIGQYHEKRKEKEKKEKKDLEGCFGERPDPKITTSFFDFLANGSAALLA
jgi:hypothetical protein